MSAGGDGRLEAALDRWVACCRSDPGRLPEDVELVQSRLIRHVGRGVLPDGSAAFLKLMHFPRWRDRIRYVHRDLPARHEARMLERVARLGVRCPRTMRVVTDRLWLRWPRLSLLVTEEVPRGEGFVTIEGAAHVAARLAAGGIHHPDLHRENFLPPVSASGEPAVLDLQSARSASDGEIGPRERRAMAAKLAASFGASAEEWHAVAAACVSAGLLEATTPLDDVVDDVRAMRRADLRRRVDRCFARSSTEFVVESKFGRGRVHWRRSARGRPGRWMPHPRAEELWIGDRVLEVVDGEVPMLGGLFRKSLWFRGERCVYIADADGHTLSTAQADRLLEGFSRMRHLLAEGSG